MTPPPGACSRASSPWRRSTPTTWSACSRNSITERRVGQWPTLRLEVPARAQLVARVDRLLAELGQPLAAVVGRAQAQLGILEARIEQLADERVAAVVDIHDGRRARREVEDVEGLLLARAQVEVIAHRVWGAHGARAEMGPQ